MCRRVRTTVPSLNFQKSFSKKQYHSKLKLRKEKQKRNYNKRHNVKELSILKEGDRVWVQDLRKYGKVVGTPSTLKCPRSYLVECETSRYRRNRWHLVPAPFSHNYVETNTDNLEQTNVEDRKFLMLQLLVRM